MTENHSDDEDTLLLHEPPVHSGAKSSSVPQISDKNRPTPFLDLPTLLILVTVTISLTTLLSSPFRGSVAARRPHTTPVTSVIKLATSRGTAQKLQTNQPLETCQSEKIQDEYITFVDNLMLFGSFNMLNILII